MYIKDFIDEFARYRVIGQKAMEQVSDAALNRVLNQDGNSIAMLVRHISGNLASRFTDFLNSDGEKPDRQRDREFDERTYSRAEVDAMWLAGWQVVERELGKVTDADLTRKVTIRGVPFTAHEALCRLTAHAAYHIGQIVLLARILADVDWRWISIPKGKSQEYNQNPRMEKRPE
jgi:hypothetical protein